MPHVDQLRRDRQLKPHHMPDPTGINAFEIAGIDTNYERPFGAGPNAAQEPVHYVRFRRCRLPLKLTNARLNTIAALLGPDTERWVGRKIGLIATGMQFGQETRLELSVHIATVDHLEAQAMMEPGQRPSLGAAPARPALAAPPSLVDPLKTKPLPREAVDRFCGIASAHGQSWDGFLAWLKAHCPEGLMMAYGVELDAVPHGLVGAMGAFIASLTPPPAPKAEIVDPATGEVITPASPQPAAGKAVHPSVIAGAMAQPAAPAPVPGATHGKPADPDDDIPF